MDFAEVSKPNHNRGKRKRKNRSEFPDRVRKQIIDDQDGQCQICGRPTTHIHHVWPRGRGGRGVYTNGLLACHNCHNPLIHNGPFLDYYINLFTTKFGPDFYKDDDDLKSEKGMN